MFSFECFYVYVLFQNIPSFFCYYALAHHSYLIFEAIRKTSKKEISNLKQAGDRKEVMNRIL